MRILHFADLHLGVENYGRVDPATGLSSRLSDFLSALDQVVAYALDNSIDLVLFCGDAYKTREPSQTQQREFARRINRLSGAGIPLVLITGNHDLPNAVGRATATEIFDTLAVRNVHVCNRPDVLRIETSGGPVQVVSLPWLRRSALLGKDDTRNLNAEQIRARAQDILTNIIVTSAARLDQAVPAVLAAHVWVAGATVGSERLMTIGQEHSLLLSNVALPVFDYVALGHIHRHQVLSEKPPVVYAGSLERVDFGEEKDEKGFCVVELDPARPAGERVTSFRFHPVNGRRFLSINVTVAPEDLDATAAVLGAIAPEAEKVRGAIVRLNISLLAEMEGQLRDADLRNALKEAHYFAIARDVQRRSRLRLGPRAAEEIGPLEALKAYLESKKVSPDRMKVLLEYGARLIEEKGPAE